MRKNIRTAEQFYLKLNSAFGFIFILVLVSSGFGIYVLYDLGQVINTIGRETFPATLAAMKLSQRTALIAASAPTIAAVAKQDELEDIYREFEKNMAQNRDDLVALSRMGAPDTIKSVTDSLERISLIAQSLRSVVNEKLTLGLSRNSMLNNLIKLQADLDDSMGPLIWGTVSLTKLFGKRMARSVTQDGEIDIDTIRSSLNQFTDRSIKPLQTVLDIKAESALLMSLLNLALHVASPDDIFPLQTRANRSLNVFLLAAGEFYKSELARRNPVLSGNLSRIEKSFVAVTKNASGNPFELRRMEIAKESEILSLLSRGRNEAGNLSGQIDAIVSQVRDNLYSQTGLVSRRRITGAAVLGGIALASCFLSVLVAVLTTKALRNRDNAIQKAVVAAERANRFKSQFLANMSHEIRTPMNSVIGFLELVLEDSSLSSDQRRYLATANFSAQGLLSLINDILDVNKLESGKLVLERELFNLNELIDQIWGLMEIKASEKGVALECTVQGGLPSMFRGDAMRLRQILVNLVGNAIKFTHVGSVKLIVMPESDWQKQNSVGVGENQGGLDDKERPDSYLQPQVVDGESVDTDILIYKRVHFIIRDTGIGIEADRLETIFEPFIQADSSTTRRYGGTGLGTTISRQIVQLMGGTIWAESREGAGSEFHFVVPLPAADGDDPDYQDKMRKEKNMPGYKGAQESGLREVSLKILLAEDVEANALLVKTRLGMMGHEVSIVSNGIEAVEAFRNSTFDIILMDVHMPDMDGMAAAGRIREIEAENGEGGHVPIIALTASIMKDEIRQFLASGMDAFVGKPIDFSELTEKMEHLLPDHSKMRADGIGSDYDRTACVNDSNEIITSYPDLEISQFNQDLDFRKGMHRWQDAGVYVGSLISFADEYADVAGRIMDIIQSDMMQVLVDSSGEKRSDPSESFILVSSIQKAYALVHALKGISSNLSLTKVYESVSQISNILSSSIKSDKAGEDTESRIGRYSSLKVKDITGDIRSLGQVVAGAIKAIDEIGKLYPECISFRKGNPPGSSASEVDNEDIGRINGIIDRIEECMALYSPDGIEPLIEALSQYVPSEDLRDVRRYVDDFNFTNAADELKKVAVKLGIPRS